MSHDVAKTLWLIPCFGLIFPTVLGRPFQSQLDTSCRYVVYVIKEHRNEAVISGSWRKVNVNGHFCDNIQSSGMEPWKKPFHRMQGNFITDLLNDGYGIHTVAEWSGNSPRIILERYVRILPSDFARASVTLPRNELQSLLKNKELHQEKCVTKSVIQEGKRGALNATSNKNPLFSRTSRKGKQGITWSADGEGFEPTVRSPVRRFSRPVP